MLNIDQYAYSNKLRSIHPGEKLLFALMTMIIGLIANSIVVSSIIILLMIGVITLGAKIPSSFLSKLLLLPLSFLLVGIITIIISVQEDGSNLFWYINLWGVKLGFNSNNLVIAANLFLKSLASVSCLYFLTLTTPMIEIMFVLKKLNLPDILVELMALTYRLLFIFLELANQIKISQLSRLGYSSFRNTLLSLSKLVSSLFVKAYDQARKLLISLEARGYQGKIKVLEPKYTFSKKNLGIIILVELILILIANSLGGVLAV